MAKTKHHRNPNRTIGLRPEDIYRWPHDIMDLLGIGRNGLERMRQLARIQPYIIGGRLYVTGAEVKRAIIETGEKARGCCRGRTWWARPGYPPG